MALGRRKREQQEMLVATTSLPQSPGHPFYEKLNRLLAQAEFDEYVEELCRPYYAGRKRGRGGGKGVGSLYVEEAGEASVLRCSTSCVDPRT